MECNTGATRALTLGAGAHQAFFVDELLTGEDLSGITSAILRNAGGIIGVELFGSGNLLDGILLTDDTATTMYYPHVVTSDTWWTGIVAYNPSTTTNTITITPYSAAGTTLASVQLDPLGSQGKLVNTTANLNLDPDTAWFVLEGSAAVSGFELFAYQSGSAMAGYCGTQTSTQGVFAKLEKEGWTGIAFVNTEATAATVTLTAYTDAGAVVATGQTSVPGHGKQVNLAEGLFSQDIGTATYLSYSSDKNLIGFQLNSSSNDNVLDALPGL
ncbi:MAG: hypothetical protein LUQ59_12415 [Methanothrix sp.]|nr:hypothetical protein [Methanothrix sp.]